jgi:hypothetical protein
MPRPVSSIIGVFVVLALAIVAYPAAALAQPYPQTTNYLVRGPRACWVSAYGPSFAPVAAGLSTSFGGRVACTGSTAGQTYKQLEMQLWYQTSPTGKWVAYDMGLTYPASGYSVVVQNLPKPIITDPNTIYAGRVWVWAHVRQPSGRTLTDTVLGPSVVFIGGSESP